ncbi:YjbF family lipoprotein [Tropicibacter sp. S64]|uniref:YjbF family lipoprotein n=1 Tax=Tropicibacter sp. S64 TaxID=3415122 RepID=UPI003C7A9460
MKRLVAFLCLLTLAACGNDGAGTGGLKGVFSGAFGNRAAPPDLSRSLTPQAIARFNGPLIYVAVLGNGVQAGLTPGPRNGAVQQWNTVDGASLSFRDGVLTASRGLGGDLIAADVTDVVAALRQGHDTAERVHRYLNHENALEIHAFKCEYTRPGREPVQTLAGAYTAQRIDETCFDSKGTRIENAYWIDGAGVVRRSTQWLGPYAGYLDIQRLKDR